jgi:hypothetical protein
MGAGAMYPVYPVPELRYRLRFELPLEFQNVSLKDDRLFVYPGR